MGNEAIKSFTAPLRVTSNASSAARADNYTRHSYATSMANIEKFCKTLVK
jgi:hypothetical protein